MRAPVTAWVALGANLGQAADQVRQAMVQLQEQVAVANWTASRLFVTAPHQALGPDFVNAVVRFDTSLTAPELLDVLQGIEQQAGRERPYPNAPRTLDLDLLFYGQSSMQSPRLTLPHPRWRERAFVLYPLADVSPERVWPGDLSAVADQTIKPLADS